MNVFRYNFIIRNNKGKKYMYLHFGDFIDICILPSFSLTLDEQILTAVTRSFKAVTDEKQNGKLSVV